MWTKDDLLQSVADFALLSAMLSSLWGPSSCASYRGCKVLCIRANTKRGVLRHLAKNTQSPSTSKATFQGTNLLVIILSRMGTGAIGLPLGILCKIDFPAPSITGIPGRRSSQRQPVIEPQVPPRTTDSVVALGTLPHAPSI